MSSAVASTRTVAERDLTDLGIPAEQGALA